ncbi:MAG: amidohydrolase family protein, partial [Armatimonadetes bacterium]|nr:amidohydrolase family protein [Armatimonadota bacterium]
GPFMTDGRSVSKVTQGVTTEIMGELWTPAPFGGRRSAPFGWASLDPEIEAQTRRWTRFSHWMEFLSRRGVAVNFGSFVGGGTVREFACGMDAGAPSEDELDLMRRITAEAMEDGALGIATALIYPPNCYSPDHELIELARVVARYGGLYVTHMRSEGDRLLESLEDTIALSRESHAPVEIYHLKATGGRNWSKVPEMIARIDRARADGVDVTADMYPYVASGTGLTVMLPYWVSEGGRLYESLEDPEIRRRLRSEMLALEGQASPHTVSRDYVVPVGFKQPENQHYVGRNLMEIAEARGESWPDTVIALLRSEQQRIGTVFFTISEPNVRLQLQQPWIKVSTDAGGISPEGQEQPVHPRGYGTYPRVLGKYVREERALTLEHAVRIMTSSVADRLGLRDRGLLRPGMKADVVVLDPHTVADRATFTDSHQLSTGIRDVWVNGVRVLQQGVHTGALPGRFVGGSGRR